MSDIYGNGYGYKHNWQRGFTPQYPFGGAKPSNKYTEYKCRDCGATFRHYYDIEANIFRAIKRAGVPENCSKQEEE